MKRAAALLALVAFFLSCGGHWMVLQGVAWVRMVQDFSANVSIDQAIVMTVSGKYPCSLCKKIADKRSAEQPAQLKLSLVKKEFLATVPLVLLARATTPLVFPDFLARKISRHDCPDSPPPNVAV